MERLAFDTIEQTEQGLALFYRGKLLAVAEPTKSMRKVIQGTKQEANE